MTSGILRAGKYSNLSGRRISPDAPDLKKPLVAKRSPLDKALSSDSFNYSDIESWHPMDDEDEADDDKVDEEESLASEVRISGMEVAKTLAVCLLVTSAMASSVSDNMNGSAIPSQQCSLHL